uniref:Large ribosomal subunit protein uL18c n=1 Tax=Polysiphonia sp. TaxID=1967842 RepID=A0A1Z1MTH2_9FLOR|nr:ribosomal protein L18 [Polysiphonia sp.]
MKLKENERFRLYIFKSNKHIYAYLINDNTNTVITSSSTISKNIKGKDKIFKNCATAHVVGRNIGIKIKNLGIEKIIFDRGNNTYHGQVKAIADATRAEGIIF